ncbi:hypothetical protein AMECASPLE_027185, partial [Ameca splendens]
AQTGLFAFFPPILLCAGGTPIIDSGAGHGAAGRLSPLIQDGKRSFKGGARLTGEFYIKLRHPAIRRIKVSELFHLH